MIKIGKTQIAIAKRLKRLEGEATADELESNYVDIEPLIRSKYVRVISLEGVAIYVMTPAGLTWAESLK